MKVTTTMLLLFLVAYTAQAQKYTTIQLAIGDCRRDQMFTMRSTDTICFYKLPEDTLQLKIVPKRYNPKLIKLENIPLSSYRLIFKNNFGQGITKEVALTDQEINTINICQDSLSAYPQNTLAKLQDNDTLAVNFRSQGCFHFTAEKILIIKEKGKLIARLYDDENEDSQPVNTQLKKGYPFKSCCTK